MKHSFEMDIDDIQPSQLYISKMKLEKVIQKLNEDNFHYEPVPITKINHKIVYTDGHTRAFALFTMGITKIKCIWDEDDLDMTMYQACVNWCLDLKIENISHLQSRILKHEDYEVLWYKRCQAIQTNKIKQK